MTFRHTLDSLEAVELAREISRLVGGEKYLAGKLDEIQTGLLARPRLPSHITRGSGTKRTRFDVKRSERPAATERRLPPKNRAVLKRDYPQAYAAVVKETPPEHAYHVRIEAQRVGRTSYEWTEYRQEGERAWAEKLAERFGRRDWSLASEQAATLHELREIRLGAEKTIDRKKLELVQFVIAKDLPLAIPGLGDGQLKLKENGPSFKVDYDRLEKEFKAAAVLINRIEKKGSVSIAFSAWAPTLEEPDDSDDSGFSVAYRERLRRGGIEL